MGASFLVLMTKQTRTGGESPGSEATAAGGGDKEAKRVAGVGEGRSRSAGKDIRRAPQRDTAAPKKRRLYASSFLVHDRTRIT